MKSGQDGGLEGATGLSDGTRLRRYLTTGLVSAAVNVAAFSVTAWMTGVLVAGVIVGYAMAYAVNFVMNRRWAFEATESRILGHAWRFAVAAIAYMGANSLLLWAMSEASVPLWSKQALCIAVLVPLTFVTYQKWVFK